MNPSFPATNPFGSTEDSIEYLNFEEFNNLGTFHFDIFLLPHSLCFPEEDSFNEFCASLQYDPFHPDE
jgi:hypothetical protein